MAAGRARARLPHFGLLRHSFLSERPRRNLMYLIWDKWAVRVCTGFSSYIGEYKYMVRKDRFILCLVLMLQMVLPKCQHENSELDIK